MGGRGRGTETTWWLHTARGLETIRVVLVDTTQHAPSSPLFLEALETFSEERGSEYSFVDEADYRGLFAGSRAGGVLFRLLARRTTDYWRFNRDLVKTCSDLRPDVVLIVKGPEVAARSLRAIKERTGATLVNFATDDPFNPRVNSPALVTSIPYYDLYVTTKKAIIGDLEKHGARRVEFVPFGFKPSIHFPEHAKDDVERRDFSSDVCFIGGADVDRVPYFETLIDSIPSIRLSLYGGYWDRYASLATHHRGMVGGRDYRLALSGSKICVNLVRKANRDGHVMRTFEVPACGGFMLAERTAEHREMFSEDETAAFFEGPDEMIEKIKAYLPKDSERERIAERGCRHVRDGSNTYYDRLCRIVELAGDV